jgi:hypothetical protein
VFKVKSSQVKLLITNNSFCIVQRATAQSKTGKFRDCGVAEAPPGFQAGWSDCMHFFSLFLFIMFAHLVCLKFVGIAHIPSASWTALGGRPLSQGPKIT